MSLFYAKINEKAFTLIEVMFAIAIIAIGIGAVIIAENNSLDTTFRARRMTTVAMLAKNSLIEAERELEGKTFDEVKKEATGKFDAPYAEYSWERKVKEINFPNLMEPGNGSSSGAGADKSSGDKEGSGRADANVERVVKIATSFLSKSSREVSVTILWKEKGENQKFSVSQYWVDLKHEFNLNVQP